MKKRKRDRIGQLDLEQEEEGDEALSAHLREPNGNQEEEA